MTEQHYRLQYLVVPMRIV